MQSKQLICPSCGGSNLIFPFPFKVILDKDRNPVMVLPFDLTVDYLLDNCTTCADCGFSGGING